MQTSADANFNRNYQLHLQHLKLKGMQAKTIDAYSRAIRRIGVRFDQQIDALRAATGGLFLGTGGIALVEHVKLDLYGQGQAGHNGI